MRYPGDRHVYHFLAPGDGHPTWEEHFIKKSKCKVFFLSHTCKLNQQTHWGVVSKSAANI